MGRLRDTKRAPSHPTPTAPLRAWQPGPGISVADLFIPGALAPVQLLERAHDLAMAALANATVPRARAVVIVVDPREPCGRSVIEWIGRVTSAGCEAYAAQLRREYEARLAEPYTIHAAILELDAAKRVLSGQRTVNQLLEASPPPGHVRAVGIAQNRTATIHMIVREPLRPVGDA